LNGSRRANLVLLGMRPKLEAFAKMKTYLCVHEAHVYDVLWRAIGDICDLFHEAECRNFFKTAGYVDE